MLSTPGRKVPRDYEVSFDERIPTTDFVAELHKMRRWRRWVASKLRQITTWLSIATKSPTTISGREIDDRIETNK